MPKYEVIIPVAGAMMKFIEAPTPEEAIRIALTSGIVEEDIQELDVYENLFEGNVCHLTTIEASAEEVDDEPLED